VFAQHLVECGLVGVIGGALGLGLSVLGVRVINSLFLTEFPFTFDLSMFLVTLGLALLSAFIAGVYPAWRVCRVPPALHLKTQ
jgi:putative ABC transport system permease protein